jgi:hypothetical protein
MNGVVFQISAMMITANELKRSPNQALSSAISGSWLTKPVVGSNAYCQENAATTVMIPYGIRTETRTIPRPKIALYMTRAMIIPSTSSIETAITVMNSVLKTSVHHSSDVRTVT